MCDTDVDIAVCYVSAVHTQCPLASVSSPGPGIAVIQPDPIYGNLPATRPDSAAPAADNVYENVPGKEPGKENIYDSLNPYSNDDLDRDPYTVVQPAAAPDPVYANTGHWLK